MTPGPVLDMSRRLSKLRAMSSREIAARVEYRLQLAIERRRHARGTLAPAGRLRSALRRSLQSGDWETPLLGGRRSLRGRFFAGTDDQRLMQTLFETRYRSERDDTIRHAAAARAHRFEFFGGEFSYGDEIDWQADPVTGKRWPEVYHADVPVHGGDVGYGDVKHVWELSRQQYLIDLAKSHFLTGERADLEAMKHLVSSWIAGNPYATGVNWACALEPAFRTWSWLWAYHLTAPSLDRAFHLEWLTSFHDHGRFLSRHLEHYSSPYNHLIGEASALFVLGMCFPEFTEAGHWQRLGRSVLENRLSEQFYDDGGSVEQSTFYHHASIGFYLLAAIAARRHGADLSPRVWAAIERGLEFSMALTQPDGKTPAIGGADDGKPIRLEHLPFWDFRPYLAVGAVLFNRTDFRMCAGRFHEDALWLLGADALATFDGMQPVPPADRSLARRASGYYVLRSDWSVDADYVCFDCGEQAAGMRPDAIPNSMHGHADCLSVILWLGGRAVLVDSGLYAYNCGGAWEAHFRETAAHNTARVDGRDQARHIRKMAWSHSYRATAEGWSTDAHHGWALGSHDGYARTPLGVTHRRAVWLRDGGYVLIYDEFVGAGEHDLELNYQFAPGNLHSVDDQSACFNDSVDVTWHAASRWTSLTHAGGDGPDAGWICESLGRRVAAPRLTLRSRFIAPRTSVLTVIADRTRASLKQNDSDTAPSLIVAGTDGWADIIAASGAIETPLIETDAFLATGRVAASGDVQADRVGGTYVRIDPARLRRYHGDGDEGGR